LNGRYDDKPERKKLVESELGIRTPEDLEQARLKYANLSPHYFDIETPLHKHDYDRVITYADYLPCPYVEEVGEMVSRINMESLIERNLTKRQQRILQLFSEGLTMGGIADELNTTETVIRGTIRTIRVIMKRCFAADNKEEVGSTQNI
jgi:hypothetical protein